MQYLPGLILTGFFIFLIIILRKHAKISSERQKAETEAKIKMYDSISEDLSNIEKSLRYIAVDVMDYLREMSTPLKGDDIKKADEPQNVERENYESNLSGQIHG